MVRCDSKKKPGAEIYTRVITKETHEVHEFKVALVDQGTVVVKVKLTLFPFVQIRRSSPTNLHNPRTPFLPRSVRGSLRFSEDGLWMNSRKERSEENALKQRGRRTAESSRSMSSLPSPPSLLPVPCSLPSPVYYHLRSILPPSNAKKEGQTTPQGGEDLVPVQI